MRGFLRRRGVRRAIQLILALTVFYFVAEAVWSNWERIAAADISPDPTKLVASVVVLLAYFLGRALLWHVLAKGSGIGIPPADAVAAWFYSQLGKYVPGKAFLFLGRLAYYRRQGHAASQVSATFLVETLATLLASVVTVLVALMTTQNHLGSWRPLLAVGLVSLVISVHPRLINAAMGLALRLFRRTVRRIDLTTAQTYGFVSAYLVNWVVYGWAFYLFVDAIYPTPGNLILYLTGSFSFATLVGMFSIFVPSGLGVREGILIVMLSQVMPQEIAITASLAARAWFTLSELGAVGLVRLTTGVQFLGVDDLKAEGAGELALKPTTENG